MTLNNKNLALFLEFLEVDHELLVASNLRANWKGNRSLIQTIGIALCLVEGISLARKQWELVVVGAVSLLGLLLCLVLATKKILEATRYYNEVLEKYRAVLTSLIDLSEEVEGSENPEHESS